MGQWLIFFSNCEVIGAGIAQNSIVANAPIYLFLIHRLEEVFSKMQIPVYGIFR